jgi:hypothetical protein
MDLRPYANAEGPRLQYYQLPPEQPSPSAYAGEADWIEGAEVKDTLSAGMGCDGHHMGPSMRFAKNRVDRAPPRPVRVFLPSATGCRMALPVAKTTRSRLRGISPPPVGRRFPTIQLPCKERASAAWAYANEDCRDVWKVPAAPTAMHQHVTSSIRTLLISVAHVVALESPFAQAVTGPKLIALAIG